MKQIPKKQENANKQLQAVYDNLKKENEDVSTVNKNLFKKLHKLEKKPNKKVSRFVACF